MNRRYATTLATPQLERGEERPTPACDGKPYAFDVLIDYAAGAEFRWAVREAREMCATCPIQLACYLENKDEQWMQALMATKRDPTSRPTCGTARGANAHYRNSEASCDTCRSNEAERSRQRKAAKALAAKVNTLADIPEVVRVMHSQFTKLKKAGEDVPQQIIDGERTYQALRHKARKARAAA